MATFTINIKPATLYANSDEFITSNITTDQNINVLSNDLLGVTPTSVFSVDNTGFTLGTIIINIDNTLKFTPNGNIGTSQIIYTIKDSINRMSSTVLTITTMI